MPPFPGIEFKRGDKGPEKEAFIKQIQKALGLGPGGQTGVFGPQTEQLVVQFQRAHGLDDDGVVGKNTWGALFGPAPSPTRDVGERALAHALTYLSVRERPLGSNRSPEIDAWNAGAGAARGSFWCMSFVYAMVCKACAELGLQAPAICKKTASCSDLYAWAKANGRITGSPRKGDIFLCKGGHTGHYHTGLVASDPQDGRFETVEGNSNPGGSANGIGVFHRKRGRRVADCHFVSL